MVLVEEFRRYSLNPIKCAHSSPCGTLPTIRYSFRPGLRSSGKVNTDFTLEAFNRGANQVLVAGYIQAIVTRLEKPDCEEDNKEI